MQKKIIALAVAGLMSGAAFAQSNVTVYGIVDAAYVDLSTNNTLAASVKSKRGIDSSGLQTSRLGFRGTEDLGGGLKANFVLEYTLVNDANRAIGGGAAALARQQTIGLSSNSWGAFNLGRMLTLTGAHNSRYAALFGTGLSPEGQVRGASGTGWDYANRVSNTAAYVSPNMSGFNVAVARVFGVAENGATAGEIKSNDGTTVARQTGWDMTANYAAGPVGVGLAYQRIGNTSAAGNTAGTRQTTLGGSYDLGVVKLMANYTNFKTEVANDKRGKGYSLSAVAPVTATGNVHFSYATSKGTDNALSEGAKSWALAYTHGLSKRTTAYVGYSTADAKSGSTATFYGNTNLVELDKKARLIAAGLSHSF
ncbi:MAG: porin [Rhodocyclaceae bacterium]|nr:porin [Rhodocyclaceae bacterium]MDZ4213824.1 porin [Rhodocyclaceae bacterium]